MSSRLKTETFPASGRIVLLMGNFLMLVQTAAAVTVRFFKDGTSFDAENVQAGYVKGNVDPWDRVEITGTAASSISFLEGIESINEDFTDYRRTVGVFQAQLAATVLGTTDVAVGAGATTIIAANAARRKVTIKLLNTADTNIRVGPNGTVTTTRGIQLEPGQSYTYEGTAELSGIREGGTTASVCILEEIY